MIFSRGGGRHAAEEPKRSRSSSERSRAQSGRADGGRAKSSRADEPRTRDADADERDSYELSEPEEFTFGPYDISESPDGEFLDLGSLKIPSIEGVEVRVQANNEGVVQQVILSTPESALQLAVFAAPRNESIWDEVRGNIRKSLASEGVKVQETPGDYGQELRAHVRAEEGATDLRFVGIDGPRWMVRAIYQGRAAIEPDTAGLLAECLRGLVVDRGREAMPAEEALPLRLPREMAEAAKAQMDAQAQAAEGVNGREPHPDGGHAPSSNSTGDHPTAGNDQQRRPSPRPRRPE